MQIVLDGVAVQGRRDPMLAPFDLTLRTGEAVLVAAEPGHGHTALALAATGRLVPSSGRVTLEGAPETRPPLTLADVSAVVDVPGVSEPVESIPVHTHVAEDLALARRRTLPRDVAAWWRTRRDLELVSDEAGTARVEGAGAERARIEWIRDDEPAPARPDPRMVSAR